MGMNLSSTQNEPQIFHLNLRKKWFDMIYAGVKKQEYREIKPYWNDRFKNGHFKVKGEWVPSNQIVICFSNGYNKNARRVYFSVKWIEKNQGSPTWGAELNKYYWVITLDRKIYESP